MIAAAAALALVDVPTAPVWVPVGQTASRLRAFVDRASVHDVDDLRRVRVRLGSPTAITGRIVLVYQDEEIDCRGHRWRQLGFEALDEDGKVVQRSSPTAAPAPLLPALEHTIGGEVARTVCAF